MVLSRAENRVAERILVIDNYDSFTWNLVHLLQVAADGCGRAIQVDVWRNDSHTVDEVLASRPAGIVLSPGPDSPAEAGICVELLRRNKGEIPVFGVCLGHQCLAAALGGRIIRAHRVVHGKVSRVHHDGKGVFDGLPSPMTAMRYHSLVVEPASLPASLVVSAWLAPDDEEGGESVIMGLRHRDWPVETVQFHPESIATEQGQALAANIVAWLPTAMVHRRASEGAVDGHG